ncbi:MAG: adenosylhomocysteinase [Candidatus Aenigmarchaeota archaeon]|nr:adenosylhomocysteinase [Candidatus Aenigmarchaeota archaeon]
MDTGPHFEVKKLELAEQGQRNIELAEMEMGALMKIRERFAREQPLKGVRVGMALHLTKETAVLVRTLRAGGADVAITGCNPLSAQDDVCAALAKEGVKVWGYKGETKEDYYRYLNQVIAFRPQITIDDGCDLVTEIHTKHPDLLRDLWGGCEETTTGVVRLKAMEQEQALRYPIVAVNDNRTKHLMDNFYGTGQSTLDGIMRASNILFAGKTVVVAGYGSCGKGVALRARGMGSQVIVTEVDPFRALQAVMDGHRVMPMTEAARIGDIFITVTGNKGILRKEHFQAMKSGAILANSGHFDVEIDLKALATAGKKRQVRPSLDEYDLQGKKLFVAGEGRLVNLAAAEGHPSLVMSMSFCGQALAVEYLVTHRASLQPSVISLPSSIDDAISRLQLEAMGLNIDGLTAEQDAYAHAWKEGT